MDYSTDNFFYRNRKEKDGTFFFKSWLPLAYFPTQVVLRKSNIETATRLYKDELNEAIVMCKHQGLAKVVKKFERISDIFSKMPQVQKQPIFSSAYIIEKRRREEEEKRQNQAIIQNNINGIINNCNIVVNRGCSLEVRDVLSEVRGYLQHLNLTLIGSDEPIASGILDVSEGVNNVMSNLSERTKHVLTNVELSEPEFSMDMNTMLGEFIENYNILGPDFDPASAGPVVSFPKNERDLGKRRMLLTIYDLLEGLRNTWSLKPLLGEAEYSENSYVIHTVSRVVDPIFNYYKWNLQRSWESVSNSSQTRKESMRSVHSGDRPDLQILLKLDSSMWELAFVEVSRLAPRSDKQNSDWKKLNRLCKDGIDARLSKLFKEKDVENNEAKHLINELRQIPFIGIQVIQNRILVVGTDFYNDSFYRSFRIFEYTIPLRVSDRQVVEDFLKSSLIVKCYLEGVFNDFVRVKDRIDRLPAGTVGNERLESSMSISTTY